MVNVAAPRRPLFLALLICAIPPLAAQSVRAAPATAYGSNVAVGRTFTHDGVKLYYEVYGSGEPLLVIHPNGTSIAAMKPQIEYFSKHYQVIAMDTRDHGKSGDSTGRLTYEKMAEDLAALLDLLKVSPVNLIGWSDGAIEALLLGMRYPAKVRKIAATGANLNPSTNAIYPETVALVNDMLASIPAADRDKPQVKRTTRTTQLMLDEPHIDVWALEAIKAPTLIMAGDHDLIRDEHTLDIFHHIPNSQLAIFPNSVHTISYDDPALFNATVEHFFSTPFVKRDRIKDAMKTLAGIQQSK
jgi:pimeloyl-ACP methyl ester carboxylesterase